MKSTLGLTVVFLLAALLFGARVDAFAVYMTRIVVLRDYENGGVPEFGVVCDLGTQGTAVEALTQVVDIGVEYTLDPPFLIDDDLEPGEEHECFIVELDDFETYNDADREDSVDDPVGWFTVSQEDFEFASFADKALPDEVAIRLECDGC